MPTGSFIQLHAEPKESPLSTKDWCVKLAIVVAELIYHAINIINICVSMRLEGKKQETKFWYYFLANYIILAMQKNNEKIHKSNTDFVPYSNAWQNWYYM